MSTICPTVMSVPGDRGRTTHASAWYRQPVLWLGVAIFIASMAGCVWIIVVSMHHADTPMDAPHAVFGVPTSARSSHGPSP